MKDELETVEDRRSRRWAIVWLALIVFMALGLRYRGMDWPKLHPDEGTIAAWADWTERHHSINQRLYAGGFFQLVKPALMVRAKVAEDGIRWRYFAGSPDASAPPRSDRLISFLRTFNVWLAAVTVGLFYVLAHRVTNHRGAALAAAAFLALSRLHVEHSHYAETDIAMLFMLSLALYVWLRVSAGARVGWFLVAAFVTGWAIGTKFTLATLVANLAAGTVAAAGRVRRPWKSGRVTLLAVAGITLCLAGLVYTNPGMTDSRWFVPQLKHCLAGVYAERSLNSGPHDPLAAIIMNWDGVKIGLAELSPGWFPFLVAGLALSFLPRYRRLWPVTLLFPAVYAVYFIFIAPWVRGQEFLAFYPAFSLWIAIGVWGAMAWARRTLCPRTALAVVVAVLVVAAGESALSAWRMAGLFGWPDPRVQALQWMQKYAPLEATVGVESYTDPVIHFFPKTIDIEQVEWTRTNDLVQRKIDYVIRNVPFQGRGSVDPRTMRLYPANARNLQEFQTYARRLCQWGPMGETRFPFAGPPIEWWETRPCTVNLTIVAPLFRPLSIEEAVYVSVPGEGVGCGGAAGALIDRTMHYLVVNGPGAADRTLWVVLQTAERPAEVMLSGPGCRRKATLAPYDVAVVPLKRPRFLPRWDPYDIVGVHAEPASHIEYIPCFAEVAYSLEEAALRVYQKGYPDRALTLLKSDAKARESWLTYASAVAVGDWPLADRLTPVAQATLDRFEAAREQPPDGLLVNGCSGTALRDFRRLRLPPPAVDNDGKATLAPPLEFLFKRVGPGDSSWDSTLALPVRLSPGRYELRFTLEESPGRHMLEAWPLTLHDTINIQDERVVISPGRSSEIVRSIVVEREQDLALTLHALRRGEDLEVSDCELRWDTEDLFWPERRELYRMLVRHALHRGDRAAAGAWLQRAHDSFPDDAELLRLTLDAQIEAGPPTAGAFETARRLVSQAPGYLPALEVLAAEDGRCGERGAAMERGQKVEVVFSPWVKLVRMHREVATGHRVFCFEALRDDVPPLKVMVMQGHRHDAYFEQPVTPPSLRKGERVLVDIPPPPQGGGGDVTLSVDSNPDWLGGPLKIAGTNESRLRLDE